MSTGSKTLEKTTLSAAKTKKKLKKLKKEIINKWGCSKYMKLWILTVKINTISCTDGKLSSL